MFQLLEVTAKQRQNMYNVQTYGICIHKIICKLEDVTSCNTIISIQTLLGKSDDGMKKLGSSLPNFSPGLLLENKSLRCSIILFAPSDSHS